MSDPNDPPSPTTPPSAALLAAWLGQSHDLLALTDDTGHLRWCNPAFERATGLSVGAGLLALTPAGWQNGAAREAWAAALHSGELAGTEFDLRAATGHLLRVDARLTCLARDRLWTLRDNTACHQLAARAQHLSELLDIAQEFGRLGVWERHIPSGVGRWDRNVFGFWGMEPTEVAPDHAEALSRIHPADQSTVYRDSTRQAGRYAHRYRVIRPDGSVRWIHSQWEVRNSAQGTPERTIGIMVDDTEVYELARSRDDTAAQLRIVTELADIVVWRHDLKTDRVHYNDHGFKVLGIPHRAGGLTLAEARSNTHPDDIPKLAASSADALGTGALVDVEVRHRRADGAWRHLLLRRVIERGAAGEALALVGIALDVTDQHAALVALHAASERSALIARHAGIGTWETDARGWPVLWDEQMWRLRGLAPSAAPPDREGRLALVHADDRAHVLDANPEPTTGGQPGAYEFRIRMPDGSYRWLASRSAVMHDAHGDVIRRVGVNWDITEAKNTDLARQQALLAERESQAKSQFLSRMSHELRTPLNAVLGFTQLLQLEARQAPSGDQVKRLDHIRVAGEHLLTLIDDALDLSSLQAGTLRLDLQAVPIATAVAQALPLVAELAAAHCVVLHSGALGGTVRADPTRLRQVLLNLLTNAIKYNRPAGQVVVDAAAIDGGLVRLSVRDTGRGMRPDQLAHLFEPFNRLGMESEGIEGSGIGLTIVKALVKGMGGNVSVSSQPDRGTVFEVVLPSAQPPGPASTETVDAGALAPRRERSGQLLYIEDNGVNVLLVEELVKSLSGLRIVSETTGTAGVERARALRPDLILVDMQLPDFDGFEVLRRLRAHPQTASIPCIALSANAMPDDIERGLASGFDDYWTKPIRFKPFLEALDRLFPASAGSAPAADH